MKPVPGEVVAHHVTNKGPRKRSLTECDMETARTMLYPVAHVILSGLLLSAPYPDVVSPRACLAQRQSISLTIAFFSIAREEEDSELTARHSTPRCTMWLLHGRSSTMEPVFGKHLSLKATDFLGMSLPCHSSSAGFMGGGSREVHGSFSSTFNERSINSALRENSCSAQPSSDETSASSMYRNQARNEQPGQGKAGGWSVR
eukprot:CAMPEP_0172816258 /NCGR_PEP_ID=MMETSP1075-20121228/12335_1 /TAXON_ID=2916 /ORGANISM="Ceratium fusus, Strain PA161109" /LENGTH=201 /DNA_ID=CAMNT_0013656221 /DNA_START=234 /DNA_END=841 /DNA_ORIENTATION=+